MKWRYDPKFIPIFGACLTTVHRGKHLVMTSIPGDQTGTGKAEYRVIQSMSKSFVCQFPLKGQVNRFLTAIPKGGL